MADGAIEEWRSVVGREGCYEVSNLGKVRSLDRVATHGSRWGHPAQYRIKGRVLKPQRDGNGYLHVPLGGKTTKVHRLVMEAFVGPRPEGTQCAHADGDRTNNALANLRWATPLENSADKHLHDTVLFGARNPMGRRTHCANGHAFTPENTRINVRGNKTKRICLACKRETSREWKRVRYRTDAGYRERRQVFARERYRNDPVYRAAQAERRRQRQGLAHGRRQ